MVVVGSGRLVFGRAAVFLFALAYTAAQSPELVRKSQHGVELMGAGRFAEAVPIYEELVRALPSNPGLRLNLGLALHMSGRDRESIPQFETVLKSQPNSLPALLSLGAARLALGETKEAIAPLKKAVAVAPKNADTRGMLAGALLDEKRFEEAAEQYRALAALTADDPRAWYGLGMSYQGISTAAFDRLEKMDAKSPYVAALVADTRVQRRQFRSAFFFYQEALKALPGLHGIHAAIAQVYRDTGHEDWALKEESRERALPAPDCKLHAAECQFQSGRYIIAQPAQTAEALYWRSKAADQLARQAFSRLGQLPPSVELHQLRADIARNQGRPLEAAKEWRAVLELAPESAKARHELALSLFLAGDYKGALEEIGKLKPLDAESNFIAGDSYVRLEEPDKALPYLTAALAADPKLMAAHASLGLALSRLGKDTEAVPHLEKALELDEDGSLHYQLARAYQAAGATEKARATMAEYQQILKKNQEQKEEVAREAQIAPPPQ